MCKHKKIHAKVEGLTEKQLEMIIRLSSMQRRAAGRGHVGVQCLDFFSSHPRPFVPGIYTGDLWNWPSEVLSGCAGPGSITWDSGCLWLYFFHEIFQRW